MPMKLEAKLDDIAVSLDRIRKVYRIGLTRKKLTAVEDISLEVKAGEIFGLLGPNGAGKTTTLKILLGLTNPSSGSGELLGQPLPKVSTHHRIGFLPEEPYFYDYLTAEKALDLYGRFFGMDHDLRTSRASGLLETVGLRSGTNLTLQKYSKGMVQRFGIAQALLNDPDLVIMDEPSSGLDPVGQKEIRDLLLRLRDEGKTIFLSSHQLSEVEVVCDSVCIINKGRSVTEGTLSDLLLVEGLRKIRLRSTGPVDGEELSGLSEKMEEEDGDTVLVVKEENTYRALDLAREAGLELVSVEPYRRSLEQIFLEVVKDSP